MAENCSFLRFRKIWEILGKDVGAAEKTRTSTGYYPTATSTLRVYQFRHGRTLKLVAVK